MANPNNPNDISQLGPRPSDGPLAGLEGSSYKYNSFIYPLNLGQPGAGLDHYVIFYINETATTQFGTRSTAAGPPPQQPTLYRNSQTDTVQGTRDAPIAAPTGNQQGQGGNTPSPAQRGNGTYVPIRRVSTAIVLYMPEDIVVNYDAEWEDTEMGNTKVILDAIGGEGSMTEVFKSLGISGAIHATDAMSAVTGLSLKDALSTRGRLAINPHLEAIFRGIRFREFSFKFKFTPQNEKEAENVSNIISAFKFYSAPEIAAGTAGRFWIYPAEFDIKFISHGKENPFIHKISTCALKRMTVNYTPLGAWVAHREHPWGGAPPVATTIDLEFMELEIMQKQRILEGY
jgi:hypothetical protein